MIKSHHRAIRSMQIVDQLQKTVRCKLQTSVVTKEIWVALSTTLTYKCT